jgi:hypothetical protein
LSARASSFHKRIIHSKRVYRSLESHCYHYNVKINCSASLLSTKRGNLNAKKSNFYLFARKNTDGEKIDFVERACCVCVRHTGGRPEGEFERAAEQRVLFAFVVLLKKYWMDRAITANAFHAKTLIDSAPPVD